MSYFALVLTMYILNVFDMSILIVITIISDASGRMNILMECLPLLLHGIKFYQDINTIDHNENQIF